MSVLNFRHATVILVILYNFIQLSSTSEDTAHNIKYTMLKDLLALDVNIICILLARACIYFKSSGNLTMASEALYTLTLIDEY